VIRLREIAATPHPGGNRIDLRWVHPDPAAYPRVRVVRREGTHPASPYDGDAVTPGDSPPFVETPGGRVYHLEDRGLQGERVYYYSFFPYRDAPAARPDPENRVSATATTPYGYGGQMEALLPALYRRYDEAAAKHNPAGLLPEDVDRGPLRRLLEVTGSQLDQLHSSARTLLDLYDPERVDGRLLPLLSDWIGWPTDHRLDVSAQRNELRQAPSVYRTIGIIPTVEATVKRILGWESRVKEFAHNVALSNTPERLNLWARERGADGTWTTPTEPVSLHAAYEGRPAAVLDGDGTLWLFFHTLRKGRWAIWYKTRPEGGEWSPSRPLSEGARARRHPSAVLHGGTLRVFWDVYDPESRTWGIEHASLADDGTWTVGAPLWNDDVERRHPCAAVDGTGTLWLVWQEKTGGRWRLRFDRRDDDAWALPEAGELSRDGGADPFVLFHPGDAARPLWVFWSRRVADAAGQTRWEIAYRVKGGLAPAAGEWSEVRVLPRPAGADDREPAACVDADGRVELFWSGCRDRSWSVWRSALDAAGTWGPATAVTGNPYSDRAPLPVPLGDRTLLLYRSNRSLEYASSVYGATRTLDARYAGSTTVDTRNAAKLGMRGRFDDFQSYTYDTGAGGRRDDRNWYARDTVGIYLTPETEDPKLLERSRGILQQALRQFFPVQVRAVLVIEPAAYRERVYTYDFPLAEPQRRIREHAFDGTLPETHGGAAEASLSDVVPGWTWAYSWRSGAPDHPTVDFSTSPIDTSHRSWHTAVAPGGTT